MLPNQVMISCPNYAHLIREVENISARSARDVSPVFGFAWTTTERVGVSRAECV
jgi:hypothetical protein